MVDNNDFSTNQNDSNSNRLAKFISQSSQKLFSTFIDDSYKKSELKRTIFKKINQAIAQKSTVVIQYQVSSDEQSFAKYETLVGRIYQHPNNPDALMIKQQKNNQVKMISADYIKKVSIISPNYNRPSYKNK
ncbi:hypothetical protein ACWOAH_03090 [Vagococcus vulneris]|uniref:Uncharacterized protein n=1 Tax=Vagococcus vulneris TaxID=1977869 RepID=A0A429ZXR4_9ENTE|nr:hypothetical protein [Vagococcus vulneris]RST98576.1 hypothetical protein CBF37_07315 [Vagococcus vulneris]